MHPWILRGLRQRTGLRKRQDWLSRVLLWRSYLLRWYSICLGVTRGKGFLRSHRETSVRARFLCSRGSGQENPMGRGPLVIIS